MIKKFVLISGLPASGKDTAAEFFEKRGYELVSFSTSVLIPIANEPHILYEMFENSIPEILNENINKLVNDVIELKKKESGRTLLITLGVYMLPEFIAKQTKGKYKHFNVLAKPLFDKVEKIAIASFRMEKEMQTLINIYPDAEFTKILIKCDDDIRYDRIIRRDSISKEIIEENERYEKESTYKELIRNVNFDYVIENNSSLDEFYKLLDNIYEVIRNQ